MRWLSFVVSLSLHFGAAVPFGFGDDPNLRHAQVVSTTCGLDLITAANSPVEYVSSLAWDNSGTSLFVVDGLHGELALWNPESGLTEQALSVGIDAVVSTAHAAKDLLIAGPYLLHWNGTDARVQVLSAFYQRHNPPKGASGILPTGFRCSSLSADGKSFVAGCYGGLLLGQTPVSDDLPSFCMREHVYTHSAFLPNSTDFVVGADDGTIELWRYKDRQIWKTLRAGYSRNDDTDADLSFEERISIRGRSTNTVAGLKIAQTTPPAAIALTYTQVNNTAGARAIVELWPVDGDPQTEPQLSIVVGEGRMAPGEHPRGIDVLVASEPSQRLYLIVASPRMLKVIPISHNGEGKWSAGHITVAAATDNFPQLRDDDIQSVACYLGRRLACAHASGMISI